MNVTINASYFKKITETILSIASQASFSITNEGIYLQACDDSHTTLCVLDLKKDQFETFKIDNDTSSMIIGIDLTILANIFKNIQTTDSLTMTMKNANEHLNLKLVNPNRKSNYKLKLLDIENNLVKIDEMPYVYSIKLEGSYFATVLKEFQSFCSGSNCSLDITWKINKIDTLNNLLNLSVETEAGSFDTNVDNCKIETLESDNHDPLTIKFSLTHILLFMKALNITNEIEIKLSKDCPLLLICGPISCYLAPKVD
jgi:proliferating cell nuclear antigen